MFTQLDLSLRRQPLRHWNCHLAGPTHAPRDTADSSMSAARRRAAQT